MSVLSKLTGKWDPTDYARKEGEVWILSPSVFYPAMIKHIRICVGEGTLPEELIDREVNPDIDPALAARRYRAWARRITAQAWNDALCPLERVLGLGIERIAERAQALECARLWFTRALKNGKGPGTVKIRILRDDRYRLGIDLQFHA